MFILTFSLLMISLPAFAQVRQVDVLVTVVKDRVVVLPGGGSPVEEPLGVNETIVTTAAQGPAGFAQTTSRLLGFSSGLRRWTEVQWASKSMSNGITSCRACLWFKPTGESMGFKRVAAIGSATRWGRMKPSNNCRVAAMWWL